MPAQVDNVNLAYDDPMAGNTRDSLVAAAAALMDVGGLDAVTLREVGRLAGVSHNAPYKHFADKEALLAAVATKELRHREQSLAETVAGGRPPANSARAAMHSYVAWALAYPVRFKLVFGAWTVDSPELTDAATATRRRLVEAVTATQEAGALPQGDPERLTALLLALAHGAVDLALSGHLSATGEAAASPDELVDDLFTHLKPN
jgi:AcrR family transcriptional regulator